MVTLTMPKKKPNTDGRKSRFVPMTLQEMETIRDRLKKLAGVFDGICSEMTSLDMSHIEVDGRVGVETGIRNIASMAKRSKGILAGGQIDLE